MSKEIKIKTYKVHDLSKELYTEVYLKYEADKEIDRLRRLLRDANKGAARNMKMSIQMAEEEDKYKKKIEELQIDNKE